MYCKKCKRITDNKSVYCPICGSKLKKNKVNVKNITMVLLLIAITIIIYIGIYNSQLRKAKILFEEEDYYKASKTINFLFPKSNEMKNIVIYGELMPSYSLAKIDYELGTTELKLGEKEKWKESYKASLRDFLIGLETTYNYLEKNHSQLEIETANTIKEKYYQTLEEYFLIDEDKINELVKLEYQEREEEINNYVIVLDSFYEIMK